MVRTDNLDGVFEALKDFFFFRLKREQFSSLTQIKAV